MSLMLKLFSIVDAYASPKLIGFCEYVEGDTYAKLMPQLEGIQVVDWPFQSLNIRNKWTIDYKFEGLNRFILLM
jgi:hypothetical protein